MAQAFLRTPIARMTARGIVSVPMAKYFKERWVCAPQ